MLRGVEGAGPLGPKNPGCGGRLGEAAQNLPGLLHSHRPSTLNSKQYLQSHTASKHLSADTLFPDLSQRVHDKDKLGTQGGQAG